MIYITRIIHVNTIIILLKPQIIPLHWMKVLSSFLMVDSDVGVVYVWEDFFSEKVSRKRFLML
jgi:hypothetical protein